jgi:hypothetical protein
MVIGEKPFYYPYFQFGQSESTVAKYGSAHAVPTDAPILKYASTAAAITGFAYQYGKPLSLAASPQAQVGTTSILYTCMIFF